MKFLKVLIIAALTFFVTSCDDDFLERSALDQITTDNYWKTSEDLKLYVNQFYTAFPSWTPNAFNGGIYWHDQNSDNIIRQNVDDRLAGNNTITTGNGSYNFRNIRTVNIFMANYDKVEDEFDTYKQYVGEALFFRAYFNFSLLKRFGPYPYTNQVLNDTSEELYESRTPRDIIAQNIIADLDQAIEYMQADKNNNGNRLNRGVAQLFKARVALYEGTWEKYHAGTSFGVDGSDGSTFLNIATDAAKSLMDSGIYSLHNTGNPMEDYWKVFNQTDFSGSSEVMLWKSYSQELSTAHNGQRYLSSSGGGRGITQVLVNDYLCLDGQPIATSPLYKGDTTLVQVATNRDPRLSQTIWLPGQDWRIEGGTVVETFEKSFLDASGESVCPTGYQIRKGANPDWAQRSGAGQGTTSSPIFRFAEALLVYAEAKAELGIITQADLDISLNLLRDRAGMPPLAIGSITTDPNWLFPDLSPIINEVRRERHVELAAEGYRADDINRWAAHDELTVGKRYKGVRFDPVQFPDMVVGSEVLLDSDGYVDPLQGELPNGYQFDLTRDYLLPIPTDELTLNPNLTQNPGWE
ncbi:RagB/SusD family nutrient uptake outer membrane protein [Arenibacter sp. 6A1]|uniref:RagB/SusD family nutrient uptake outer membrane protein n=1 Tax=Arenibacter sp. 6A1 TaxID=2720391 RepID=UPI0014461C71|nr:RagB/SusD family nutrient uptake outer membrane protein [Arenibacter sp. 6A1]NKI27527.1 RagB/SusD family nutrient uptake outer membrane protein [Arenibacter sp. 6A1]